MGYFFAVQSERDGSRAPMSPLLDKRFHEEWNERRSKRDTRR
jgi:hypothetical protein